MHILLYILLYESNIYTFESFRMVEYDADLCPLGSNMPVPTNHQANQPNWTDLCNSAYIDYFERILSLYGLE